MQVYCSDKCKDTHDNKIRWQRHPQRSRLAISAFVAKRKRLVFEYLLLHPCAVCGENDPVVLESHHRNPKTKSFNVSVKFKTYKWEVIQKEIDKCEVLCANCHRRFHFGRARRFAVA